MAGQVLKGCRLLVVEDEYLIAMEVEQALSEAGCRTVDIAPTVDKALAMLDTKAIDAALLDLNLDGQMAFLVADALMARRIPFLFTTGYDRWILPKRYAGIPCCEKPVDMDVVIRLLVREHPLCA